MKTNAIYEHIDVIKIYNKIDCDIKSFKIDTRKINEGDCYIGIKGENTDGNLFYKDAFDKGASLVILDNYQYNEEDEEYLAKNDKSIVVVEDTIKALGNLAKYKRSLFKIPVVAVTGSAGKTSTKDIIYSVLKSRYKTQKTIGNQNNHLGLPLTVLALDDSSEVLVLEMGMNHLGEISYLTNIALPSVVVITNVGTAHIGNLGSRENILRAKLEILEGLSDDGVVVINNDNDLLHDWYIKNKDKYNILTVGVENASDFQASDIKVLKNGSSFSCNGEEYKVLVGGEHFIYNSLVAIAVANVFDIDVKGVQKGIKNFELSSNRMNIIDNEDIMIIDDSYNANYDSMNYAIKYLGNLDGRRIAVLGTMRELGKYSEKLHRDIGNLIVEENIDILITVGDYAKYINEEALKLGFLAENSYHFSNNKDAIKLINEIKKRDDKILVKASNSLNFGEIVANIK